jgi:hypothetical protein
MQKAARHAIELQTPRVGSVKEQDFGLGRGRFEEWDHGREKVLFGLVETRI